MEKAFLLTIDLEEFERGIGDQQYDLSREGLEVLTSLLSHTQIPVTFFTTATFARRYPDTIRSLSVNHEIALHAFEHNDNYRTMDPEEAMERLGKAKTILEAFSGKKVIGFRAPQMQAPGMGLLRSLGIKYDSSLHPTYVPGRYSHHREPMEIHNQDGIVRVPVSVTPRLRLAYSWLWFRVIGVWYARMCTRTTEKKMDFVAIYFHPWDFVDLRKVENIGRIYARNTHRSLEMLEKYLRWLREKGYRFMTMSEYLREGGWL